MASKAAQAKQLKISALGDFKSRVRGTFELPSGLVVKLKNPGGLQAFIANGTIPNSLLGIVQTALTEGKSQNSLAAAKDLAKDMSSLGEMMRLLDIVASQAIIEPPCRIAPTEDDVKRWNMLNPGDIKTDPEELRDDEKYLYTDEVAEEDKQFIMQWVSGGVRDLEQFRKEHAANVAALSADEEPADAAALEPGADDR
jgi:hypothetical protein